MARAHSWVFVDWQGTGQACPAPDYHRVQPLPGSSGSSSNLAVNGAQGRALVPLDYPLSVKQKAIVSSFPFSFSFVSLGYSHLNY